MRAAIAVAVAAACVSAAATSHSAWARGETVAYYDSAGAAPPPLAEQWRPAAPARARAPARQLVKSGLHAPVAAVQGLIQ